MGINKRQQSEGSEELEQVKHHEQQIQHWHLALSSFFCAVFSYFSASVGLLLWKNHCLLCMNSRVSTTDLKNDWDILNCSL